MALVETHVRAWRRQNENVHSLSSTTSWAVDDSRIALAVPSICKINAKSDGLVNSLVTVDIQGEITYLWCTDTVATILALS